MIKHLKYILYILLLTGCFDLNRPFQDEKITISMNNSINSMIYIDNIIGTSEDIALSIKSGIYNKLLKKNILASYKYSNKNSYLLKTTIVQYGNENKKTIIFNLSNFNSNNNKFKIVIPNNHIYNIETQEEIIQKITNFIEDIVFKLNKIKYIKINKITGLKNYNNFENIFFNKLVNLYSKNSIKILNNKNLNEINPKIYYYLKINFNFIEIDKEKIKIKILWKILDYNNQLLGTIEQENIVKKSIIDYIWEEISNKIIEMSLTELNMLINL